MKRTPASPVPVQRCPCCCYLLTALGDFKQIFYSYRFCASPGLGEGEGRTHPVLDTRESTPASFPQGRGCSQPSFVTCPHCDPFPKVSGVAGPHPRESGGGWGGVVWGYRRDTTGWAVAPRPETTTRGEGGRGAAAPKGDGLSRIPGNAERVTAAMSPPGLSSPCRRGRTEPDGTRENRNQRLGTAGPVPPPPAPPPRSPGRRVGDG